MGATSNALQIDHLLTEGSKATAEALKELDRIAKITANWTEITKHAALRLQPAVRAELEVSWARTGLNPNSEKGGGRLYAGWVTKSIVKANNQGILVYLQPGVTEQGSKDQFYKRAGAFQFGAVYGAGKGKRAAKFKQGLKQGKTEPTKLGGGIRTMPARPMFFDAGQMDRLAARYVELVHEEIAKVK